MTEENIDKLCNACGHEIDESLIDKEKIIDRVEGVVYERCPECEREIPVSHNIDGDHPNYKIACDLIKSAKEKIEALKGGDEPLRLQPKISINICTHRYMNPFFVNSMFYMLDYMNRTGLKFEINSHMGVSNIAGGRQQRVNEVLNGTCTHMMFIDDDTVFAMDVAHKMLHEMNTLTMAGVRKVAMGVNPCRKSPSGLFYTAKELDSDKFLKSKGQSGVAEVSSCGLGIFMIETAVLREIPNPHFEIIEERNIPLYSASSEIFDLLCDMGKVDRNAWEFRVSNIIDRINAQKDIIDNKIVNRPSKLPEHQGEDFYFIKKLREHGVRVFVDQDISQRLGHAGEYIYTYDTYREE